MPEPSFCRSVLVKSPLPWIRGPVRCRGGNFAESRWRRGCWPWWTCRRLWPGVNVVWTISTRRRVDRRAAFCCCFETVLDWVIPRCECIDCIFVVNEIDSDRNIGWIRWFFHFPVSKCFLPNWSHAGKREAAEAYAHAQKVRKPIIRFLYLEKKAHMTFTLCI